MFKSLKKDTIISTPLINSSTDSHRVVCWFYFPIWSGQWNCRSDLCNYFEEYFYWVPLFIRIEFRHSCQQYEIVHFILNVELFSAYLKWSYISALTVNVKCCSEPLSMMQRCLTAPKLRSQCRCDHNPSFGISEHLITEETVKIYSKTLLLLCVFIITMQLYVSTIHMIQWRPRKGCCLSNDQRFYF